MVMWANDNFLTHEERRTLWSSDYSFFEFDKIIFEKKLFEDNFSLMMNDLNEAQKFETQNKIIFFLNDELLANILTFHLDFVTECYIMKANVVSLKDEEKIKYLSMFSVDDELFLKMLNKKITKLNLIVK